MFMAGLPARKFRSYVCTGQAAIESKMRNARQSEEGEDVKGGEVAETMEAVYGDKRGVADVVETAVNIA